MKPLTIGSLFAGIGGLELGLERGIGNGAHTVFQVEQNAYCRAVLAKHWPDALRFDDVRTVGRSNLPAVDVLCGGFPCQDISHAGHQAGIVAGNRSGLWFEFARIIREIRPSYVVVENVAALLAGGIDIVLGDLAALRYDAEWDCLPASSVGAPHRRDRIFLVGYPEREGLERHAGDGNDWAGREESSRPASAAGIRIGAPVADAARKRLEGRIAVRHEVEAGSGRLLPAGQGESRGARQWATEPNVGRVAHGVRNRVDRLRALGNAVVPQVAEVVGRLIAEREALKEAA